MSRLGGIALPTLNRIVLTSGLFVFAAMWVPSAQAAPDVILFLADDLGSTDIGPEQRKPGLLTPNIDALGKAGIVYTTGYSQPACIQSRTAMLTGRWPQRKSVGAVMNNGPQPPTSVVTIAEMLRPQYATHMIGKWHLGFSGGKHPLDQGFDTFLGFMGAMPDYVGHDPQAPLYRQKTQIQNTGNVSETLGAEAIKILKQPRSKPLFMYVAWTAPHDPLQGTLAQRIAEMDTQIGKVVAAAKPGTLFIFAGDNGRFSNAPFRGRKFDILEGGVRVPLVLRWTGKVAAGQKVATPASLLDIAITINKAAGGKPFKTDGYDLLNLPASRAVLLKAFYDDPGYAVRRGQWKLYRNHLGVPVQLYNVSTDKGESKNVFASNGTVVKEMNTLLDSFIAELKK